MMAQRRNGSCTYMTRNRSWLLGFAAAVFSVAGPQPATVFGQRQQDEQEQGASTGVAKSSDLSTARPPGKWRELNGSVDRALEWLAEQQQEDGSFLADDRIQPAVTAFATMAFLSKGHTPSHPRYGARISKAIDYTLSTQKPLGYFSKLPVRQSDLNDSLRPGQTAHYNHAITGLMLGEVYGMTSAEQARQIAEAVERALVYSRSIQTRVKKDPADAGGFRYFGPQSPNASSDISVTGWHLMFLRSARNAEFEVPKLYFDQGLEFVERCEVPIDGDSSKGTFGYRPPATGQCRPSLANTGSAILALMMGGRHQKPCVQRGIRWYLSRNYPKPWEAKQHYFLATYYSSQAMAQAGGTAWNTVYPQLAKCLLDEQLATGAWPPGAGAEAKLGPTYSTSLAVLALTPALQMLPIYQR